MPFGLRLMATLFQSAPANLGVQQHKSKFNAMFWRRKKGPAVMGMVASVGAEVATLPAQIEEKKKVEVEKVEVVEEKKVEQSRKERKRNSDVDLELRKHLKEEGMAFLAFADFETNEVAKEKAAEKKVAQERAAGLEVERRLADMRVPSSSTLTHYDDALERQPTPKTLDGSRKPAGESVPAMPLPEESTIPGSEKKLVRNTGASTNGDRTNTTKPSSNKLQKSRPAQSNPNPKEAELLASAAEIAVDETSLDASDVDVTTTDIVEHETKCLYEDRPNVKEPLDDAHTHRPRPDSRQMARMKLEAASQSPRPHPNEGRRPPVRRPTQMGSQPDMRPRPNGPPNGYPPQGHLEKRGPRSHPAYNRSVSTQEQSAMRHGPQTGPPCGPPRRAQTDRPHHARRITPPSPNLGNPTISITRPQMQSDQSSDSREDRDDSSIERADLIKISPPKMLPPNKEYSMEIKDSQRDCEMNHRQTIVSSNLHHRIHCMVCTSNTSAERHLCTYCALRFCSRCKQQFQADRSIDEIRALATSEDWCSDTPSTSTSSYESSSDRDANIPWAIACALEEPPLMPRPPFHLKNPPPPHRRPSSFSGRRPDNNGPRNMPASLRMNRPRPAPELFSDPASQFAGGPYASAGIPPRANAAGSRSASDSDSEREARTRARIQR